MNYEIINRSEVPVSGTVNLALLSFLSKGKVIKYTDTNKEKLIKRRNSVLTSLRRKRIDRFNFKIKTRLASNSDGSYSLYVWAINGWVFTVECTDQDAEKK